MMRRLVAASVAAWAVLAVALTLALGHRTTTVAQAPTSAPVVLVRQANGTLRALPVQAAHTTTQTSGGSGGALPILGQGGQLVSQAPAPHTTTSSS